MNTFDSIVLYVEDLDRTAGFYETILGLQARRLAPTFMSLELESGLKLEFKTASAALPPPQAKGGGFEMCIKAENEAELEALHEAWASKGVGFAQAPERLPFGLTFVAVDPDQHRIRVFVGD